MMMPGDGCTALLTFPSMLATLLLPICSLPALPSLWLGDLSAGIELRAIASSVLLLPGALAIAPYPDLLLSLRGAHLLPAVLFAALAPGLRARRPAPPPLEVSQPEAARALRRMQRDPGSRISLTIARQAAMAVEYGLEGHLLVHYVRSAETVRPSTLTLAGGWLGAGRRRYMWLPLRHTLAWSSSGSPGAALTPDDIAELANDLHAGLDQIGERHVLEQFHEPAPIPLAERRQALDDYANFMQARGWKVSYDESLSRRSLKRIDDAAGPQRWSTSDREMLTRLEALVSEMLKGVRSSSRILYQTK